MEGVVFSQKLAERVKKGVRILLGREELPQEPVERTPSGIEEFMRWLFSPETLEMDEEEGEERPPSFFKWLFGREELPQDFPEERGSKGFFRWLLEKEELPREGQGEEGE
jgi:hypothetical protein